MESISIQAKELVAARTEIIFDGSIKRQAPSPGKIGFEALIGDGALI